MTYTTDAALLQTVNDAIVSIMSGTAESYRIDLPDGSSRSVNKLDIDKLRKWKSELEASTARQTSGAFSLAQFQAPT